MNIDRLIVVCSKYLASIPTRLVLLIFALPLLAMLAVMFLIFGDLASIYEE